MIHEAMVLEYSARHLALIEWSAALKLLNYAAIGLALFVPWGLASAHGDWLQVLIGWLSTALKLGVVGGVLALIESFSAKLRIFRAPEFLATAFLLAVLGLLVHQLLGS
jgi:formate hydrogenlyase subunit 4